MKSISGLKVLIADDYEINLQILVLSLKKLGMVSVVANNGEEAIALFNLHSFDLIMMDLMMPQIDGYEATRKIRMIEAEKNLTPSIIIAISASQLNETKEVLLEMGFNDMMPKPFIYNDLRLILSKYFEL
jgi:CheY-like chemotaxis protein